jgi:uncharacterized protein with GYD domain
MQIGIKNDFSQNLSVSYVLCALTKAARFENILVIIHFSREGKMAFYIILSRISPAAFSDPKDLTKIAKTVSERIKKECPGVTWKNSFVTFGRFDVVDIVESDDPQQVSKAALIIRGYGKSETETMPATPWDDFLKTLG